MYILSVVFKLSPKETVAVMIEVSKCDRFDKDINQSINPPPIHSFIYPSFIYPSICPSIHLFVHSSINQPINIIEQSINESNNQTNTPCVHPFIHHAPHVTPGRATKYSDRHGDGRSVLLKPPRKEISFHANHLPALYVPETKQKKDHKKIYPREV